MTDVLTPATEVAAVRDTGSVLDQKNMHRLFEALYTTKTRRHGHRITAQPLDHRDVPRKVAAHLLGVH